MKTIILHAQQKIHWDRSIFGLYHILQGRSSIQTIQDIKLYKLSSLYGVYRKLNRQRYMAIVQDLQEEGLLLKKDPDYYMVTSKGEAWLHNKTSIRDYFFFNGEAYSQQDRIFFNRLQLLIQVWTNKKNNNSQFIPVIEDNRTADWVKQFYQRTKTKMDTYLYHLYEELHDLFLRLPDRYPEIFLAQLSSYHHIGKTTEQLAYEQGLLKEDIYLMTTNVLHYLLSSVLSNKEKYPVLNVMMKQPVQVRQLTKSAALTAKLLKQGLSAEAIAEKRSLKLNTIQDHVVELVMQHHPSVVIQDYITDAEIQTIEQAVAAVGSYKLKEIKEAAGEAITFFKIRVVLAKMQQSL